MSNAAHYEINVSRNGKHYFATHPRSLQTYSDEVAVAMARDFAERFPAEDGFEITVTFWDCSGRFVNFEEDKS